MKESHDQGILFGIFRETVGSLYVSPGLMSLGSLCDSEFRSPGFHRQSVKVCIVSISGSCAVSLWFALLGLQQNVQKYSLRLATRAKGLLR